MKKDKSKPKTSPEIKPLCSIQKQKKEKMRTPLVIGVANSFNSDCFNARNVEKDSNVIDGFVISREPGYGGIPPYWYTWVNLISGATLPLLHTDGEFIVEEDLYAQLSRGFEIPGINSFTILPSTDLGSIQGRSLYTANCCLVHGSIIGPYCEIGAEAKLRKAIVRSEYDESKKLQSWYPLLNDQEGNYLPIRLPGRKHHLLRFASSTQAIVYCYTKLGVHSLTIERRRKRGFIYGSSYLINSNSIHLCDAHGCDNKGMLDAPFD